MQKIIAMFMGGTTGALLRYGTAALAGFMLLNSVTNLPLFDFLDKDKREIKSLNSKIVDLNADLKSVLDQHEENLEVVDEQNKQLMVLHAKKQNIEQAFEDLEKSIPEIIEANSHTIEDIRRVVIKDKSCLGSINWALEQALKQ